MSLGRTLVVDGRTWTVVPTGFVTHFARDEFGLLFATGDGDTREYRVARFSPLGVGERSREAAFQALGDADLRRLLRQSQPTDRSPEGGYRA
ncbi:MAG: hypothetical protein MUF40_02940 [Gemmatimonadaceae bacterium]|nr:hypothetical protein [Gemmatimonadaceae bacterium]